MAIGGTNSRAPLKSVTRSATSHAVASRGEVENPSDREDRQLILSAKCSCS